MRLQVTLNISNEEIFDLLKMNRSTYSKFIKGNIGIGILEACDLADKYSINIESIVENNVDFDILRNHHLGDKRAIPEKYLQFAYTKKRGVVTALEYINQEFGWFAKESALRYFQLTDLLYNDPDGYINVDLTEELFSFILRYTGGKSKIGEIGNYSFITSRGSLLDRELSVSKTPRELFEKYFSEITNLIEYNNYYAITHLDNTRCIVESREIKKNIEERKVRHVGGQLRCDYRVGALKIATKYMGLQESEVTETECSHRGGCVCRFEIRYGHLNKLRVTSTEDNKERILKCSIAH